MPLDFLIAHKSTVFLLVLCKQCHHQQQHHHHDRQTNTLYAALANKRRAALMQAVIKRGSDLVEDSTATGAGGAAPAIDDATKAYWKNLRGAFGTLATKTPGAK